MLVVVNIELIEHFELVVFAVEHGECVVAAADNFVRVYLGH